MYSAPCPCPYSGAQFRCCTNPQWPWPYLGLSLFDSNPAMSPPDSSWFQGIRVSPLPKTLQCLPTALRLKGKSQPRPAGLPAGLASTPPSPLTSSCPALFTPFQQRWTSFCSVNTTNLLLSCLRAFVLAAPSSWTLFPQIFAWLVPVLWSTCYPFLEAFLTFPIYAVPPWLSNQYPVLAFFIHQTLTLLCLFIFLFLHINI